jgi:predicted nucleotidyltransferase
MRTLEEIKEQLKQLKPYLKTNYSVKTMEVFGSYVRKEQTRKSDVDILVTFYEPNDIDLFKFIELRLLLKDKIGINVDLVEKKNLKPIIRDNVLKEAIPV